MECTSGRLIQAADRFAYRQVCVILLSILHSETNTYTVRCAYFEFGWKWTRNEILEICLECAQKSLCESKTLVRLLRGCAPVCLSCRLVLWTLICRLVCT